MELQRRLDVLVEVAESLGIGVRAEPLGGDGGGLCTLRGRRILFLDTSADVETQYERTLNGLAGLKELDDQYILPEVRDDIEAARRGSGG
ncbi:MAG: hypothetical protein JXQ73_24420 [Phycisphaerae bacterium]|nr:hypothetical protein [Phycisphaerae bacterium]